MKLIVGLGNPGNEYIKTRHNAGFIAIDTLLEEYGFESEVEKFRSKIYTSRIKGEKILFVKPLTYMNLSGEAIREIMNFYKIDIKDFIVLYDDKDLNLGQIRFRSKGSAGGHNGIKNIIQHLSTQDFNRVRIGIDNPPNNYKIVDWVLSKFKDEDIQLIKNHIKNISGFIQDFANSNDFVKIMNNYN